MRLEGKQVFSCSVSGVLLLAIIANIVLTGAVTVVVEEPAITPLTTGTIIYLPADALPAAELVYQGQASNASLRVALTFDSGWIFEYTSRLLDILCREQVVATFFHRGKWAETNPELVKRMVAEGHLIGNHTYTHPYMDKLSPAEISKEIKLADSALEQLIGYKPWLYRPPYGLCTPTVRKVLAEHGYTHSIMWTIDTHDWKDPGVRYIVNRVVTNAKDGAIVLMHVGAPQTVQALPIIIKELRDKDYEFVLLDELLSPGATADGRFPYRVREGDTLQSVALKFGVTEHVILDLNPMIMP